MRDGVKLHTEFYTPKKCDNGTANPNESDTLRNLQSRQKHQQHDFSLCRHGSEGYIFAFQDIRGRYGSEGKFVMLRPLHDPNDPKGVDESTDTYDTIDWLGKKRSNNSGRVGLDGISYDGFLVTMGMNQSSSRAQGCLRTGLHGRHLARRRLLSQRRFSPELRL